MGLHPNHKLVTHGPYRFVRHPWNVLFPLNSIVLFLMSANWVLGAAALSVIGIVSIVVCMDIPSAHRLIPGIW